MIWLSAITFDQPEYMVSLWLQAAYGRPLPLEQIRLAYFLLRVGDGADHQAEIDRAEREHQQALVQSEIDTAPLLVYFCHDERGLHLHCGNPVQGYTTRLTCLHVNEADLIYALTMVLSEDVAVLIDGVLVCAVQLAPHLEWLGGRSVVKVAAGHARENRPCDMWQGKSNEVT